MTEEKIRQIKEIWKAQNEPLGLLLGYPQCCIDAFCDLPPELMKGEPTIEQKQRYEAACINGAFTGFVPCIDHARLILIGDITLNSLIKNRNGQLPPFPDFK